jgi:glycosyltransferase involved in cell wall biosynthesis
LKKVLFISHDASLSGAPILLLNLLEVLKGSSFVCDRIIIKNDFGPLSDEFKKFGDVLFFHTMAKKPASFFARIARRFKVTPANNNKDIQRWIEEADIVFSNTITNGDLLARFTFPKGQPVISYIHELEMAAAFYSNAPNRAVLFNKSTNFAVPSQAVRNFIHHAFNIPLQRLHPLNYYIPSIPGKTITGESTGKAEFIVGMIGTLDWRKGAALLPVLVADFFNSYPAAQVKFAWQGADPFSVEAQRISYELKQCGFADKVIFREPSRDTSAFYEMIDVLLLCSKEDPYPLVVLEAAMYKKPCICFDKAGGATEFVKNDAGTTVPYLDIRALSNSIFDYYSNRRQGMEKGETAYGRYVSLHADKSFILHQFEKLLSPADKK